METVNVRFTVPQKDSASVHYIAQSIGIPVYEVYGLVVSLFLFERDLEKAVKNLGTHRQVLMSADPKRNPLPFED